MHVVMEMLLKTLLFVLLLLFSFELCFPEKLTLFYFFFMSMGKVPPLHDAGCKMACACPQTMQFRTK